MNYLEICKAVCREAGTSSVSLSDVTGHVSGGDYERICGWVASAWDEIQLHREDWWWMRSSFTILTTAGDNSYLPSEFTPAVTNLAEIDTDSVKIYKQSEGIATQRRLGFDEYPIWNTLYNIGAVANGSPTRFTVKPDMGVAFNVPPDSIFVVTGDYSTIPTTLTTKTDIPTLPVQFHPAITYLALQKYASYEAAPEVFIYAKDRYDFYLARIEKNQLPSMGFGGPIA